MDQCFTSVGEVPKEVSNPQMRTKDAKTMDKGLAFTSVGEVPKEVSNPQVRAKDKGQWTKDNGLAFTSVGEVPKEVSNPQVRIKDVKTMDKRQKTKDKGLASTSVGEVPKEVSNPQVRTKDLNALRNFEFPPAANPLSQQIHFEEQLSPLAQRSFVLRSSKSEEVSFVPIFQIASAIKFPQGPNLRSNQIRNSNFFLLSSRKNFADACISGQCCHDTLGTRSI